MPTSNYTGTIGRTLPDIIGDYPSVMAWGAVGDGVTDDTAAFNAAFSATAAIGGTDVLFIPANRIFIVTALTLSRNGFRLLGSQGQDPTNNLGRIKLKNATNAVVLTVSGNNCRIEGVNIDGNASNQTVAHPAVEITGAAVTLASSLIRNSKGDGVKITSADSTRLSGNTIRDNALFGINVASATNALLSLNELANNTSGSLTTSGAIDYRAYGNVGITDRSTIRSIVVSFDGGGLTLAAGTSVPFVCPYGFTLQNWSICVDTGTCTLKVWKKASGTAIPTTSDSINTSGISISTGTVIESTTLSDFTNLVFAPGDIFIVQLLTTTGATQVTLSLGGQ